MPALGCGLLFLKKRLQRLFGILFFVHFLLRGAHRNEVVAEIGPFLINNSFRRNFHALIISARRVKLALLTASKIPPAMWTSIVPAYFIHNIGLFITKYAVHDLPPSDYAITTSRAGALGNAPKGATKPFAISACWQL